LSIVTNARFKLEAEKQGLHGTLAVKAANSLDAINQALNKMKEDLNHDGL